MDATAKLRYYRASPQKVRLVADLIRGRGVEEAASMLQLSKKHAARDIARLLKSAIANAENRAEAQVDIGSLYVKEIVVDGGPTFKRFRPQPQGRIFRIIKRHSHITIRLGTRSAEA